MTTYVQDLIMRGRQTPPRMKFDIRLRQMKALLEPRGQPEVLYASNRRTITPNRIHPGNIYRSYVSLASWPDHRMFHSRNNKAEPGIDNTPDYMKRNPVGFFGVLKKIQKYLQETGVFF